MDKLMKREQVMEILGISRNTLDRIVADGALPVVRVRGQIRYLEKDLELYIARSREEVRRPAVLPLPDPPTARRRRKAPQPSGRCEYYPGMKVV